MKTKKETKQKIEFLENTLKNYSNLSKESKNLLIVNLDFYKKAQLKKDLKTLKFAALISIFILSSILFFISNL